MSKNNTAYFQQNDFSSAQFVKLMALLATLMKRLWSSWACVLFVVLGKSSSRVGFLTSEKRTINSSS